MTHSRMLAGALVALTVAAVRASAQPALRQLTLVQDGTVDLSRVGGVRDVVLGVGADARVIVAPRIGWGGNIVGFDSSGKPLAWKLVTGFSDKADVGAARRIGWVGGTGTMWIDDPLDKEVALVDERGTITKSIENASWIHPSWAERRRYPLFRAMEPLAVYPDETMLVEPYNERSFFSTPSYDRSATHLLRITYGGAIRRTVATIPAAAMPPRQRGGRGGRPVVVPFAAGAVWDVSADGARIAIVQPGSAESDSGRIRVTMLDERGDTVYDRRYPYISARVSKEAVDNYLASLRPAGDRPVEQLRDSIAKQIPAYQSFITGVFVGRDQSAWIVLRPQSDTAKARNALVLDPRGEPAGMLTIPADREPAIVALDRLWAFETGRMRTPVGVVRYAVKPTNALPARSPKAATLKPPSHPPK